jgi:hypothetical protein
MSGNAFSVAGAGVDLASQLRAAAKALLIAADTLAGNAVESCRNDAQSDADPFFIAIYTTKINRSWLGDSPPQFKALVSLAVIGRVQANTLAQAERLADTLRVQMENALLASSAFYAQVTALERVNTVDTTISFPEYVKIHEGVVTMVLECQCVDIFPWIAGVPLDLINLTVPDPTTPGLNTVTADNMIGAAVTIPQGG